MSRASTRRSRPRDAPFPPEPAVDIELLGPIRNVEAIAWGSGIRDLTRLRRAYGGERWRKLKGVARVRLPDGNVRWAEVHWYHAHGLGRRELKVKRLLGERA